MSSPHWDQRFFESTRGRIVTLLRPGSGTVDDLARELDLTDNAVRMHLAALGRDGLVQQRGVRRGAGKPAYSYELTPEAEHLFPKAYQPVLNQLLDVLSESTTPEELEDLLRRVGRRMATGQPAGTGNTRTRIQAAVAVLNELGGLAELEEHDGTFAIRGYSCPLAATVSGHPEVCKLAETLLTELTHLPIHEHCDKGDPPRCHFEVLPSADGT